MHVCACCSYCSAQTQVQIKDQDSVHVCIYACMYVHAAAIAPHQGAKAQADKKSKAVYMYVCMYMKTGVKVLHKE